jgi:hypothetical protein
MAFNEKHIPNSESQFDRHIVGKQSHEPLSCVHCWQNIFREQVVAKFGHELLKKTQKYVE